MGILKNGGIVLLGLAAISVAGGYLYVKSSLPEIDGTQVLAGISDTVTITRDVSGIPHIEAASLKDASFGLGYSHAQDRLWQMEINRRIGAGRLSEILGSAALGKDKFLRTLGVYQSALVTFDGLDESTKTLLQAYADGVNSYLTTRSGALPPEFLILGTEPAPWTTADSVVWSKMMSWDLGKNWAKEIERMRLMTILGPEKVNQIMPPYPGDKLAALPDLRQEYKTANLDVGKLFAMAPEPLPDGAGSNNWVVAGNKTVSGKPLLANDPHLGLAAPALWYFAHMKTPNVNTIGATLPGVPGIILGRNDHIAWGFTNTGPDVQDLFIEKINPDDANQYKTPEGWADFSTREETILIKDAEPVVITVRATRHGPVISDALGSATEDLPAQNVLAFAWTTLLAADKTPDASEKMMRAKNWDDFRAAIKHFTSPQQNMVYADVDGNIGYYAPGLVPIRKPENTAQGRIPVPGWLPENDWDGFIPFSELPQVYNPSSDQHYTANEKIIPDDYPHFISSDWTLPYRANRIKERLEQEEKHSMQTFIDLQSDVKSGMADEFLGILLTTKPSNERAREALTELSIWDGKMTKSGAAPLIFNGWIRELNRSVYADELGDAFESYWKQRPIFLKNVLLNTDKQGVWCDDINTEAVETCEMILQDSLTAALDDLEDRYGDEIRDWNWGEAHFAHSDHIPFSRVAGLNHLFDIKVPSMGGTYTVNVGRNRLKDDKQPFANSHAASLRAIYDFSDLDNSLFIHSTGQSGNIMSPLYDDMAVDWAGMKYRKMTTNPEEYRKDALGVLTLTPLN
ncbi:MAG: penicillin acylase family protein [Pseudomonas marincola]